MSDYDGYDYDLGRAMADRGQELLRNLPKPTAEPDGETRRIVQEVASEYTRFGPKQIQAEALRRHRVELDLTMIRGALAERDAS